MAIATENGAIGKRYFPAILFQKTKHATLYQVKYIEGICSHPTIEDRIYHHTIGFHSIDHMPHIKWSKSPDVANIFCSDQLPVFMGMSQTVLHLSRPRDSIVGRELNYVALYAPTCYGLSLDKFYSNEFRNTHKFPTPLVDRVLVSKPNQLFTLLEKSLTDQAQNPAIKAFSQRGE